MRLFVTLFSILVSVNALAAELPSGWTNARALGMGNAFTTKATEGEALFYNPAGLAHNRGVNWTVFNPRAGLTPESLESVDAIQNFSDDIPGTLNELYGKRVWAGLGANTAITVPNFGVAGFVNTELGFFPQNPVNPDINLNYYFDYGIILGAAFEPIPKIWSVGLALRRVNRTGNTASLGAGDLAQVDAETLESEMKRRGTAYGLDLGTTLQFEGRVNPAISFVYRDIGTTTFSHEEGAGAPQSIKSEMILGASLKIDAPGIEITPALDYRYLNRSGVSLGKNLNFGVEVSLPLLDLRAGFHQGYYTLGAGVDIGVLRVDVATWGVELGEYPGQQEDRRYLAQVTFELGFDPAVFGLSGSNDSSSNSRRRLKQRR